MLSRYKDEKKSISSIYVKRADGTERKTRDSPLSGSFVQSLPDKNEMKIKVARKSGHLNGAYLSRGLTLNSRSESLIGAMHGRYLARAFAATITITWHKVSANLYLNVSPANVRAARIWARTCAE